MKVVLKMKAGNVHFILEIIMYLIIKTIDHISLDTFWYYKSLSI